MNRLAFIFFIFLRNILSSNSRFLELDDLSNNLNKQLNISNVNTDNYQLLNFTDYENLYKSNLINNKEIINDTQLNEYLNTKSNLKNISNVLFFGEWKSNKFLKELNNDKGKIIFRLDLQRYLTFSKEYYYEFFWQIELIRDDFYKNKVEYIKNTNNFFDEFQKLATNLKFDQSNLKNINTDDLIDIESSNQIDIDYERNIFTQTENFDTYDQQIFIESYNKNFATKGNIKVENIDKLSDKDNINEIKELKNKFNISDITEISFSNFRTQISKNYMRIPLFAFTTISNMNLLIIKNKKHKGEYINGQFNLELIENNEMNEYEITFNVQRISEEKDFYNTPFLKITLLTITFSSIFNSIYLLSYIEKSPSNSRYVSLIINKGISYNINDRFNVQLFVSSDNIFSFRFTKIGKLGIFCSNFFSNIYWLFLYYTSKMCI